MRSPLRGRGGELRLLQEFTRAGARAIEAQYAPLTGAILHRANLAQRRWPDVPALLLSGGGGVGKSALISELIRKLRGPRWDGRVVVHFDFDEPALKAGDQGAMLLEAARQIALARPALDEALSASRANLRRSLLEIERSPSGAYERLKFAITVELSSWKPLLAAHGIHDLVLVLDTLEEVTVVDFARLDALFGWLDTLRVDSGLQRVQVIGSGRALVPDGSRPRLWPYFLAELALGDLGARAARAMLRDRLLREKLDQHVEQVWRCVEVFGSNPLVLSILARYCADNDVAALIALLDQARSDDGLARFGDAAQRFLYGRILERVRDADIKPLANPGLVLRRVTPTLIQEVLAGPCGLGAIDTAHAQALLQKLQRLAWLVTPDGDGLRHRRDVRRQMLGLILDREGPRAVAVNQAAARWYAKQANASDASGPRDAALLESWYHRGLLGEIASDNEADLRALGDHLGEDVEDLPVPVRAVVKLASGRTLTLVEQEALPERQRAAFATQQSRRLRVEGLDSAALDKVSLQSAERTTQQSLREQELTSESAATSSSGAETSSDELVPIVGAGDTSPDSELVKALFANGKFEQVAAFLPKLLVEYWQRVQLVGSIEGKLANLPVYLAAIAARAFSSSSVNWSTLIGEPTFRVDDIALYHGPFAEVLSIEMLLAPVSKRQALLDDLRIDAGDLRYARLPHEGLQGSAEWQLMFVWAMTDRFSANLRLSTLPFLHPDFVDLMYQIETSGTGSYRPEEVNAHWKQTAAFDSRTRGWRDVAALKSLASSGDHGLAEREIDLDSINLSAVARIADRAHGLILSIDLSGACGSGFIPIGLVPEFYAPIRTAFQGELQPPEIARLVDQVAGPFRTWPSELAPLQFEEAGTDRSNELLPILLTIADYHGCLGTLVRAAAKARPDAYRIGRVAQLFDAFEAAWAL
ncbi:hypothetical protein [Tahibacter sp.]|uniref:hypothetical protein n=1 Tax=Tahibacter sp. TaxID=2056211 RepID=UPI0028C4DD91|nr:hypothetical protein [Tahibacter sp.]